MTANLWAQASPVWTHAPRACQWQEQIAMRSSLMGHLKHPQSLLSPSLVKLSNQWLHPMKPMKVSYISSSPRHNPLAKCLSSMINGRNGSMSTCQGKWRNGQCHAMPPLPPEIWRVLWVSKAKNLQSCTVHRWQVAIVFLEKPCCCLWVLCVKPTIDKSEKTQSIWEAAIEHVNGI